MRCVTLFGMHSKLGVRVKDVATASVFYQGLVCQQIAVVPGRDGRPVLAVLLVETFYLIVDAVVGLPFPDTDR